MQLCPTSYINDLFYYFIYVFLIFLLKYVFAKYIFYVAKGYRCTVTANKRNIIETKKIKLIQTSSLKAGKCD